MPQSQRDRRLPTATELALEIATLREELGAIQRAAQVLADFSARVRIEDRIAKLRDEFEDRLLAYTQALERDNHELAKSYRLLKLVTDAVPDPIYVKDRESRFLMGNTALGAALGVPVENLIGKTGAELLPPEVMEKVLADDRRIMDFGARHRYEETIFFTPSHWRRYLTTKIPFRDINDNVVGLVGVSRDITPSNDDLGS